MIQYNDLERHFVAPAVAKQHKRIPRRLKKKHHSILNKFSFLTLNQRLWYLLEFTNPDYKRFLIKQICKQYGITS